jgi:hypothetical protein
MFLPYRTTVYDIDSLVQKANGIKALSSEKEEEKSFSLLKSYVMGEHGVINGSKLQSTWFPTNNEIFPYDIFISHSHNDLEKAKLLASWLENDCGLKCFLDAYVWESADKLLKEIDDEYCFERSTGYYNYNKRNFSTSHIHAMLSMAIMDIMDRTECAIFIQSDQSITLENIRNTQTLSPWLYEELSFMKKLRMQIPPRYMHLYSGVRMFSSGGNTQCMMESKETSLNIAYDVDLSSIQNLSSSQLWNLRSKGNIKLRNLDELYASTYIKKNPLN